MPDIPILLYVSLLHSRITGDSKAYASPSAVYLFEANIFCVTADYEKEDKTTLSVLNSGRYSAPCLQI